MKKIVYAVTIALLTSLFCYANENVSELLKRIDSVSNSPKDQKMSMKLILIDKDNSESEREIVMMQKGADKRVGKFLSPKDQKGIGFLSLPGNVLHIYLPAYKKVKNIASHAKNGSFAGTDFTYEDMEMTEFSKNYEGKILSENDSIYVIELIPEKKSETSYSKIVITVPKETYFPVMMEFYEKDKHVKTLERKSIEKVKSYYVAREMTMTTLKSGHKTKMLLESVEYDTNISDDFFTDRYLKE
ncbi:MAG: outer membrane lipoprotein-sorting protein [bacterium]|nr:outer membrane lipoprotein-sorting protein [bacterium]